MFTIQLRKRSINPFNLTVVGRQITSVFLLFFILCFNSNALTIEEYNKRIEAEQNAAYEQFSFQWQNFLTGKSRQIPRPLDAALARESTEDYLVSSGGLKKVFAEASRKNTYGFTFKRPVDDPLRNASFHRAYSSIFIEVDNIPSNEWLIRFVHEVSHSLDSELYESIDIYGNEPLINELEQLGKAQTSLRDLPLEVRKNLDQWLIAGLNRGFLGEYRAWYATLAIYEEGLKDGTFKPSAWLEEIKSARPANTSMRVHLLRFLSPSWKDPQKGIFAYPFIQEALTEIRQKLVEHPERIPLGNLGKVLNLK